MKIPFKILLLVTYSFCACQSASTFDQIDTNTIDLNRITGEAPAPASFFDSALWSAALGMALLAALSSSESNYKSVSMKPSELDSEWIE